MAFGDYVDVCRRCGKKIPDTSKTGFPIDDYGMAVSNESMKWCHCVKPGRKEG